MNKDLANMNENWLSLAHIYQQEFQVMGSTETFFGKGKDGFCDFGLIGIELMIQGVGYLRNPDSLNDSGNYKGFKEAIRAMAQLHFSRVTYTFKAAYNCTLNGYYTEAAILLRSILETYVRLRYIDNKNDIKYVNDALIGRFRTQYKTQFDDIAPGLYKFYKFLCGIAHGGLESHALRISEPIVHTLNLDTGLVFDPNRCSFIINQYSIYLLAHLEYMLKLFPEIKSNWTDTFNKRFTKTTSILWTLLEQISKSESNIEWYSAVKNLIPSVQAV
jgi:hypothetical protein